MRERVFAKFVRVPDTGKRGSGLGLNIVRDIVTAHGGTIGVESSPLGGARVWFVLPRADSIGRGSGDPVSDVS
jgi:signal transduction histidine kinase